MGRPLNKKYFGNRNIGSASTTADDNIGGEGIASINWSNLGLFRGNDATHEPLIGLDLPAPTLPTGVQATWTVTFEVASVSTGAGKAGLVVGDTYTFAAGGNPIITVATTSGANATFTTTAGSGVVYGSLPTDTTGVNITKVTGSGPATFLTDINFKVRSAVINEKGSGYTGAETFTVTTYSATTGAAPAGTIVLTTDQTDANGNQYASQSGDANRAGYNENAIIIYAKTTSIGSSKVGDIVSQRGRSLFRVKTADGVADCLLKASAVANAGEATITATDSAGGTYFVTKISTHRCTVTRGTGTQFATGASVPWTFGSAAANVSVKIPNA